MKNPNRPQAVEAAITAMLDGFKIIQNGDFGLRKEQIEEGLMRADVLIDYIKQLESAQPVQGWQDAFDAFAAKYNTFGNEWQDMGADQYFKAGFEAASGQGWQEGWNLKMVILHTAISALEGYTSNNGIEEDRYKTRLREHYVANVRKAAEAIMPAAPATGEM